MLITDVKRKPEQQPVSYRSGKNPFGPDLDDHCPCGSYRRARSCHAEGPAHWTVPPTGRPLLGGERTGYAHPQCYAASSADCSEDLTREHWFSKSILDQIGEKTFWVEGLRWQKGPGKKEVSHKSFRSKVLCGRHNEALSALDAEAAEFFGVCARCQDLMVSRTPGRLFAMFAGDDIERWMLKVVLGGIASGTFRSSLSPAVPPPTTIPFKELVEYLFYGDQDGSFVYLFQEHEMGRTLSR
ncbi:hypothetical protein [Pseudonocardia xishanensis]|uniref:Uncharacterized protein n=1 Tax=Pseudonocardia xishanensis TaxID=630995 RepID=A0ABP8RYE7_9PSEU